MVAVCLFSDGLMVWRPSETMYNTLRIIGNTILKIRCLTNPPHELSQLFQPLPAPINGDSAASMHGFARAAAEADVRAVSCSVQAFDETTYLDRHIVWPHCGHNTDSYGLPRIA